MPIKTETANSKMVRDIINSICPVSNSSAEKIESLVEMETYHKRETFIRKGQRNSKEYFVLEGICRSYLLNPEGQEITISFFNSQSILSPYTTRTKASFSILNFQALTTVKLASLAASEFEKLMIHDLDIRNFGNSVLRNELAAKVQKEIGLASLTAKERLLIFRAQFPMLENFIPHTDIASYLGITNISLSRLRGDLAR
jgi:CRP-like cAMP-binding protein